MFAIHNRFLQQHSSKLSFISGAFPTRGQLFYSAFLMLVASGYRIAHAQDWPQIHGPNRDGQAASHRPLAENWPQRPKIAWQVGLGSGYSGPAVADGRVLALHRLGNEEVLEALDLTSGQKLWRASWPASYRGNIDPDHGPRCVPTVAGAVVVCYGAAGDLVAVALDSGQVLWQRALRKEYRADDGYFGAGSVPLVMDQTIIVCLGGKQAGVVGIDLKSGKTKWTATDYDASYAPPVAVDPQSALVVTRLHTVLIDVAQGAVLSEISFGSRGPTVNAAAPIRVGQDRYLLTASYGVGATLLRIRDRQLDAILTGSDLVSSQYITPVAVGKRVIAIDGRDDGPPAELRSLDVEQQQVIWKQTAFGTAHLIAIGDQVLALNKSGEVRLIDGAADHYRELAKLQLPAGTYRAPPALIAGRLIARDTNSQSGRSQLVCVELPLAQ